MSFYLIYMDEYGNSGNRLDDPEQPIFGLQFAFVPADKTWTSLESELLALAEEIKARLHLETTPRLHAVELFRRNGYYKRLSQREAYGYIVRVLQIAKRHGVRYFSVMIDKGELRERITATMNTFPEQVKARLLKLTKDGTRVPAPLKVATFPPTYHSLEMRLRHFEAYGIIFFDHEKPKEDETLAANHAYKALRRKGIVNRILENPVRLDTWQSFPLAIADFSGYVYFGSKRNQWARANGKKVSKHRRPLERWSKAHVEPFLIQLNDLNPSHMKDFLIGVLATTQLFSFDKAHSYDASLEVVDKIVALLNEAPGPFQGPGATTQG